MIKVRSHAKPVLTDGVAVEDLINLDKREVLNRVYTDEEVYQIELEKIWAKQWICVGHESEIPKVGDFVTRIIGDDSIIVSRDRHGDVQAMLNMCPHRGAEVCRSEAGNTTAFRCIYHGFTFNLDGSHRGGPYLDKLYTPEEKDTQALGLPKAKVALYAGIIFINWDENSQPFEDSLGKFKYYFDTMVMLPKNGLEVLGAPQRFVINANWKTAAEQFAGDGLHAGQLHRCLSDLTGNDRNNPEDWQLYAPRVSCDEGHSAICFDQTMIYKKIMADHESVPALQKLAMLPPPGVPAELVPELADLFPEDTLQMMADYPPCNGSLFPNIGLWNMTQLMADGSMAPYLSFRTYAPRGLNQFEFTNWTLVAKDASEEYRDLIRKSLSFTQGAGGFVEQDDAEIWPGIHNAAQGFIGRQQSNKYWGASGESPPEGWPGEGLVFSGFMKDDTQWLWWQRYFKEICS